MKTHDKQGSPEAGFALILALLILTLLTTMGLALSTTTTTEMQISLNHRWTQSARYNAEAGIEYGKSLLTATPSWAAILPPPRTNPDWLPTAWNGGSQSATTGTPRFDRATRNFESWQCDKRGYGMGYGVVLDDGSAAGAEENRTTLAGVALNGAFTLWIRRPVEWNGGDGSGGNLRDYANDDVIVLVAEGVAPFTTGTANVFAASNRSVYAIETVLVRGGTTILDQSACSARQGQAGGSSSGGNSAGCIALTGGRQITESLAGSTDLGAGGLK